MNDFDKDYESGARPKQRSRRTAKRRSAKRQRQRQRRQIAICAFALIFVVALVVVLCKSCSESDADLDILNGIWYYDEYTEYEFDGKGKGCMLIGEGKHYEFTYTIDGDTLGIDYELDYVTDCEYTFRFENDTLILVGGTGTAEPGQEYTLKRVR